MGNSAVLKDLTNRPAGYIRLEKGGGVCRACVSMPAQAAIIFSDGSQQEIELKTSSAEQFFSCEKKQLRCAYIFRGENLLLATDASAREAFLQRRKPGEPEKKAQKEKKTDLDRKRTAPQQKKAVQKENPPCERFPQRRWPPPPGWESACYRQGSWTEYEKPPEKPDGAGL